MKIKIFKDFIGDGFDTVNLENEINNFIKNKKYLDLSKDKSRYF